MTAPDLVTFLRARLTEDEEWANYAGCRDEHVGTHPSPDCRDRVLADIAAKRTIVDAAEAWAALCPPDDWPLSGGMDDAVRADTGRWLLRSLAGAYAWHEDHREEWKP